MTPEDLRQTRRERWDEVSGRRVRSLEAGWEHTSGPLVVVVPGLGALGYLLDTLAGCAAWARSFLLDVPGFGRRGARACAADVQAVAETVSDWLEEVPDGPVVLAGHSTGAQAAPHVATTQSRTASAHLPCWVPPFHRNNVSSVD
jgi:pimeloyl-ACP methyl ester carboxylesterase